MITPLTHSAESVLKQLAIVVHNLKDVPFQQIIDSDDALQALVSISSDLIQFGSAMVSYIDERDK